MTKNKLTRRKFIGSSALTLSGMTIIPNNVNFLLSKKKNDVLKLGVIGVGNRGKGLLRILNGISEIKVVAISDINDDNIAAAKKIYTSDFKVYKNYLELLDSKEVEAVLIVTPLYMHYSMAVEAINRKKHLYVEKAISYDIPQAIDLANRVKDSALVFQVGHQYRYYGLYKRLKEVIDKGWIGKVMHYECQYHRNSDWRFPVKHPKDERIVNWRMYKEFSGGLMTELCGHPIDVVNWMVGSNPIRVSGMGGVDYWKDGRENYDNVRVVYEYPGGVKSSVSSILSNSYKGYGIRVLGDKGSIIIERDQAVVYSENIKKEIGVVDGVSGATITTNPGQGKVLDYSDLDPFKKDPTYYALVDFAVCIKTGKKPAADVIVGKDVAIASHMANIAMDTRTEQYWKPEYSM